MIWPGANGASASAPAAAEGPPPASGSGEAGEAAAVAADQDDLPFWDWSSDQSELDDPSDAFAPDRPEDPDGPDYPDYGASGSTESPRATPAAAETGGFRGGLASWEPRGWESRRSGGSSDSGTSGTSGTSGGPATSGEDKRLRRPRAPVVSPAAAQADEPRREGIGQHLGNLAHLSADPGRRSWQWRAAVAIVVMVAFSILANWLVGLTLAVLSVIAITIVRSRRALVGPGGMRVRETAAQRRTRRQLRKLERAGYRAVHCAPIAGSDDQIDHLVVGPAGVFAFDSEAWDRRLPVRAKKNELWLGPFSMTERLDQARWESEQAAAHLSSAAGTQVTVRPAMAVYGPRIPWDVATIRDVDVFSGARLRRYLRRMARRRDARLLTDSQIERIDKAAQTAYPQAVTR